jgi:hypothetical protein
MNYTLQIDIAGAEEASKSVDDLLKKVGDITSPKKKISFNEWLKLGSEYEDNGKGAGDQFGKGFASAYEKALKKMANETEPLARSLLYGKWEYTPPKPQKSSSVIQGLKEPDWSKVTAFINTMGSIHAIQGLAEPNYAKALAGISAMGDITQFDPKGNVIRGLRTPGGKDLAKVMALPDITSYEEKKDTRGEEDANNKSLGLGLMTALFNPWIGSRLISDSLSKSQTGKDGDVAAGIFGSGGSMRFAAVYDSISTLKMLFKKLGEEIAKINAAYERSIQIYANATMTGTGLQWGVGRSNLARVLGVSEQDVYNFGTSVVSLSEQLKTATNAVAGSTRQLTAVEQQEKIYKANQDAFAAEQARTYSGLAYLNAKSDVWASGMDIKIRKGFNDFLEKLGLLGPKAPPPAAFMKQLPASSWEKMGLVVGQGGNSTNDLIRKSNGYLATIARAVTGGQPNVQGHNFMLSPQTANP